MHVTAVTCVSKMVARKRVVLSLNDKVKVIRLHEKGNSSRKLAAEFNMGKTQINNIIAGKEKVIEEWDGGVNGRRKLVTVRKCAYVGLNAKVGVRMVLHCTGKEHSADGSPLARKGGNVRCGYGPQRLHCE